MNIKCNKKKGLSPAYLALVAALLFGGSTPICKLLIEQISPQFLAGLLYLGSGIGLTVYRAIFYRIFGTVRETTLKHEDIPWLAGAIISGGIAAPLLLMLGLTTTPGTIASLLLNLETVFTALLAWFAFKENFSNQVIIGMIAIVIGGVLLSWTSGAHLVISTGSLIIITACLCWGLDNNLTRNISASDPIQIAAIKGLTAGLINCAVALILGSKLPTPSFLVTVTFIGFLGYGISLSLYIKALRYLGTARASVYFSTAPFAGAFLSLLILHEPLTINFLMAAIFMGIGVWLHLTETHKHEHSHEDQEHEHMHVHNEHHQHDHSNNDPIKEPHNHLHRHIQITHLHEHFPDIDHRHNH